MNEPWAWGLAFLLGVIVGHYKPANLPCKIDRSCSASLASL
jgi:hypothetical protein